MLQSKKSEKINFLCAENGLYDHSIYIFMPVPHSFDVQGVQMAVDK